MKTKKSKINFLEDVNKIHKKEMLLQKENKLKTRFKLRIFCIVILIIFAIIFFFYYKNNNIPEINLFLSILFIIGIPLAIILCIIDYLKLKKLREK